MPVSCGDSEHDAKTLGQPSIDKYNILDCVQSRRRFTRFKVDPKLLHIKSYVSDLGSDGRFSSLFSHNAFLQGWSSAYTIEAVIMQISATLVKGKARIKFDAPKVILSFFIWHKLC